MENCDWSEARARGVKANIPSSFSSLRQKRERNVLVVVAAHETKLQEALEELGVTLWLCRAAISLMIHRSVQVQINAHLRQE